MDLPDIISQIKPRRVVAPKVNTDVPVWGKLFVVRSPAKPVHLVEQPRMLDVPRSRRPYLEDGEVPTWGKAWRRKTGPKSDRPAWEKRLGVSISFAAWGTCKKREQRGRVIDAECILEVLQLRGEL